MGRRRERTQIDLTATMYRAGRMSKVQLENVADQGLGASAPFPPGVGEQVELTLLGKLIKGRVAWAIKKQFGVQLADPLPADHIGQAEALGVEASRQRLKNSAGEHPSAASGLPDGVPPNGVGSMRDALIRRLDNGTLDMN